MTDKYAGFSELTSQAERWAPLAAFDTDLTETPKGLYCNAAGTVVLKGRDGVNGTFSVAAGQTLDMRPKQVVAAGTSLTTAQIIVLLD